MRTAYCFDLDGTLTRQELLPLIAETVGLEDEISLLTQATIDGVLPFDKSFKLRVRLLKDANIEWIHQALEHSVDFDTEILSFIASRPEDCYVITGNLDIWVKPVLDRLGIRNFASKAKLDDNGKLVGIDHILHKGDVVAELRQQYDRIIAVGDGMNDVPMFEAADWRIAYGGTHPPTALLVKLSDFVIYDRTVLCRLLNML